MSPTDPNDRAVLVTSPASDPVPMVPASDPPVVGDAPGNEGPPLSPLVPQGMHRREDDAAAIATSPDFSERPNRATMDSQRALGRVTKSPQGPPAAER